MSSPHPTRRRTHSAPALVGRALYAHRWRSVTAYQFSYNVGGFRALELFHPRCGVQSSPPTSKPDAPGRSSRTVHICTPIEAAARRCCAKARSHSSRLSASMGTPTLKRRVPSAARPRPSSLSSRDSRLIGCPRFAANYNRDVLSAAIATRLRHRRAVSCDADTMRTARRFVCRAALL